MAKRVSTPKGTDRSPRIEWGEWADGDWWRLKQGEDYHQTPAQALRAIRSWGSRNGYHVTGVISGPNSIDVRMTPIPRKSKTKTK